MEASEAFLTAILGESGAKALAKAADRASELRTSILPRAVMSWLGLVAQNGYDAPLPGLPESYFQLTKHGSIGYSGLVGIGADDVLEFDRSNLVTVAATLAVSLSSSTFPIDAALRDADVALLGKSLDQLIRTHFVFPEIEIEEDLPEPKQVHFSPKPIPESKTITMTKSQASTPCPSCGMKQLRGGKVKFCICWMDIAKSTKVEEQGDAFLLTLASAWDADTLTSFLSDLPANL